MSAVTNAAMPGIEEIRTMGERNVIKAALLGAGTVGSGVYALAEMLKDEMFQKTGASLEIKKVLVRNTKKDRPGIPKEIMTDNWQEILEDEEIQLVIELMGGVEPARTYIVQALEAGNRWSPPTRTCSRSMDRRSCHWRKTAAAISSLSGSRRRDPDHPSLKAEPRGQHADGDHGNRQRDHELHSDENVGRGNGLSGSAREGDGTWLRGGGSDG